MDEWIDYAVGGAALLAEGVLVAALAYRIDRSYVERVRKMETDYFSRPEFEPFNIELTTVHLDGTPVTVTHYDGRAALDFVEKELEDMKPHGPWGMLVRRRARKKIAAARERLDEIGYVDGPPAGPMSMEEQINQITFSEPIPEDEVNKITFSDPTPEDLEQYRQQGGKIRFGAV
jgi:hypothetical protein